MDREGKNKENKEKSESKHLKGQLDPPVGNVTFF